MPYSVSVPMTRSTLIVVQRNASSEVLARVRDRIDGTARLGALLARDQSADVDDALALLTGDARPVVGVGRVRQVLVLAELVHAGRQQVGDADALLPGVEELLMAIFLARATMFSIMAPELKSLKYRTSLSPLA